jgi:DNA-binding PadR family transcriptional regulator
MSQDLPVTSYAVLGLLTFGDELTGYELKQRADMTLRFYWVAPAMSQIYSELARLTDQGLVEPTARQGEGRRTTTTYRITAHGQEALRDWMATSPTGFPVLKHPVLLKLLVGHTGKPEGIRAMLEEYVDELAAARADLRRVRDSLRGRDAASEPFHYPSIVADWGLDYFAAEARHTRKALERLSTESEEP